MVAAVDRLVSLVHVTFLFMLALVVSVALLWAKRDIALGAALAAEMNDVEVIAPRLAPDVDQLSIDLAMAIFSINIGPNTNWPKLDAKLDDRGLTTRGALSNRSMITIGPAAFSDWSILGSTLAHEIEIHGKQNFLLVALLDGIGLNGTALAERQAYKHELSGARRFGLDAVDREMISDTMEYFYPGSVGTIGSHSLSAKVQTWFARNILRERAAR